MNIDITRLKSNVDEYTLIDLLGDRRYSVGLLITMIMPIFIYVLLDKNIEKNNKKVSESS